jgi:hypothetical protein
MEAVQGTTKTVTFQTDVPCQPCGMLIQFTYEMLPLFFNFIVCGSFQEFYLLFALFGWWS